MIFLAALLPFMLAVIIEAERIVHMNQRWDAFRPTDANTTTSSGAIVLFKAFYKSSTYIRAEECCRQYNAHLASFHSEQEFKFLANMTKRFFGWAYNDFWLGLFHRGELLPEVPNHRLYFLDGSAYNNTEFSRTEERHGEFWMRHLDRWNSYRSEPDHYFNANLGIRNSSEYCVAISHVNYKLFDQNCSVASSFVCRYDGNPVEEATIHVLDASLPTVDKSSDLTIETAAKSAALTVGSTVTSTVDSQAASTSSVSSKMRTVEQTSTAIIQQPSIMLTNNTLFVVMVLDANNTNGIVLAGMFVAIAVANCCFAVPMVMLASVGCQLKRIRKKHSGSYSPPRNV